MPLPTSQPPSCASIRAFARRFTLPVIHTETRLGGFNCDGICWQQVCRYRYQLVLDSARGVQSGSATSDRIGLLAIGGLFPFKKLSTDTNDPAKATGPVSAVSATTPTCHGKPNTSLLRLPRPW